MPASPFIFHIAIPCGDLEAAEAFYAGKLSCRIARRHGDRINVDFFGTQLVCHLSADDVVTKPKMYPRHFGITLTSRQDFDDLLQAAQRTHATFFQQPFVRFEGKPEQHISFFLQDPSGNLIEFKHYEDARFMY